MPIVDSLDWNTLKHESEYEDSTQMVGIFEWGFLYKEMKLSHTNKTRSTEPTK